MRSWAVVVVCLSIFAQRSNGNAFTAMVKMKTLPAIESRLLSHLHEYIDAIQKSESNVWDESNKQLVLLKEFLSMTREDNTIATRDEAWTENPVNSFHLLRRLVKDWADIIGSVHCDNCPSDHPSTVFMESVDLERHQPVWPTDVDVEGAAVAILRLIHTYELDLVDLARGGIRHFTTSKLTPDDLAFIGDVANSKNMLYDAARMYNASLQFVLTEQNMGPANILERLKIYNKIHTPTALSLYKKLQSVYYHFGAITRAAGVVNEAIRHYPDDERLYERQQYYTDLLKSGDSDVPFEREEDFLFSRYRQLCREDTKTSIDEIALKCVYWPTKLVLVKAKVEYANIDPDIVLFHDVISDKEIDWMKNAAQKSFERSSLGKLDGSGYSGHDQRISQSSWLYNIDDVLTRLNHRVHLYTGLDVTVRGVDTSAEPFQVLNYGLGGMYEPHTDPTAIYRIIGYENNVMFRNSGDRIATWVYYLNGVTQGGATVFPLLNARVPAIKGVAAFWWNLRQNGNIDDRMLHAGCPVLIGSKWIANKWVREIGQHFRRPCALDSTL